jgi:hypothetical protein
VEKSPTLEPEPQSNPVKIGAEIVLSEETVNRIDAMFPAPKQDYKMIMDIFSEVFLEKKVPPRVIANFAGHFLMTMFEPGSVQYRKMNSVLADIYFLHYASLIDEKPPLIVVK